MFIKCIKISHNRDTIGQMKIYDQYGHDGLKGRGFDPHFTDVGDIFSAFSDVFGFGDIFGFGGGRGRRGGGRAGPRRGADLEYPLRLDFLEAAHGVTREISIARHSHCQTCSGKGLKSGREAQNCTTCGGAGQVVQAQGFLRIRATCPSCRGQGRVTAPEDRCDPCRGTGRERKTEKLSVTIPAGVDTGNQLRLAGKGEVGDPGGAQGNLFVTIQVTEHELFKRQGAESFCTIPVPYPLMALGGEMTVPTVPGEEPLQVPKGSDSGKVFALRGRGIPRVGGNGNGDHHVMLVVDVPSSLTEREEELLRELAELQGTGVREQGFWQGLFGKLTN